MSSREPASAESCLPRCFQRYPGIVLEVSAEGIVLATNGLVERELGHMLVGKPLADFLEDLGSRAKWERMRIGLLDGVEEVEGSTWELVFAPEATMEEPRAFSPLWEESSRTILLIEQRTDPRLDRLRQEVAGMNSELTSAQRQLLKERGRLVYTLEQLDAQHRTTLELADRVQRQNVELERSNQALDEFAQAISHDLRAPLRSIANNAKWIEEDARGDLSAEAAEHLDRLMTSAARLTAMVNAVLEFARAGRAHAPPEPIDSAEIVREILSLLDLPLELALTVSPSMPTFVGEKAPFQQVMLNLIANAARYADAASPRLAILADDADDVLEFSIADNGPGVALEDQSRIWNLFETGRAPGPTGTGLGLAITRKLVERQNGRVWVESTPGEGATFRFLWPKVARSPAVGSGPPDPRIGI